MRLTQTLQHAVLTSVACISKRNKEPPLLAAAALMRKHHFRHLVVVDEHEKLAGMLALRYLLYDLMDELERDVGDLTSHLLNDGPGGQTPLYC